ncbi:MAG: carboxypeptidase-like regulatory domain-containing protein, partial [Terracidiphilus sp.]
MSRFKFRSSGVSLCLLLTPALMFAQEGARLAVTVLDPSDAAVPGAKVTVVEKGRGAAHTGETEVTGTTYFNALNPGSYRVEVEKTGFEKYTVEDLQLHARDFQSLRLQVRVAAAEKAEVTVKGEVEGVQIDPSTGTTVNGRYASDIPSNSRSIQALVLMAPGVTYAGGDRGGGDVNSNGLRSNTNYYT